MINEVLFMEMRLIQQFCKKHQCLSKDANALFNKYGIWKYIEECYDALYDEETGLWTQGPDYFIDYFEQLNKN